MKVGDLIKKRWGKIEPEEKDTFGLVLSVTPANAWDFIAVAYPFGIRHFRMTELEVINESR